jgi:cytochrome c oxidase subunit 1
MAPVFCWTSLAANLLIVAAFPVLTATLAMLLLDRYLGFHFFTVDGQGNAMMYVNLFWVWGHPEVYILILPAFGLVSEILPTFSRKPIFGYPVMVYSGILIAFLGFGVWAHHMFAVGMGAIADSVFATTTMLIAIPTGVKIFNWIFTMWGGNLRFTVAMKYAISLVGLFVIGGISGVMHAAPPADLQQTDTYFIVAHFHYVLVAGSMMGLSGGIYYYYPKITGRLLSEKIGNWQFWLTFIGVNLTFMPMHWSGLYGMPRRISSYDAGQGWEIFNQMSTWGAVIQLVAGLIGLYNLWVSRKNGEIAGNDPWGAPTLEWSIPSPPPEHNFDVIPTVTSRYPLWDVKSPELTADVPHSRHDDERNDVALAGKKVGQFHDHMSAGTPEDGMNPNAYQASTKLSQKTAEELGIPLPYPTIKPLFVALFMVLMFACLLLIHQDKLVLAVGGIIVNATLMTSFLYGWLTSPLEPHHH